VRDAPARRPTAPSSGTGAAETPARHGAGDKLPLDPTAITSLTAPSPGTPRR